MGGLLPTATTGASNAEHVLTHNSDELQLRVACDVYVAYCQMCGSFTEGSGG